MQQVVWPTSQKELELAWAIDHYLKTEIYRILDADAQTRLESPLEAGNLPPTVEGDQILEGTGVSASARGVV